MNSTQQIKLTQYNTNSKQTSQSILRSIASLNNDLAAAIQHQVYARFNPDGNVDEELLAIMGVGFDNVSASFDEVLVMKDDLDAVRAEEMTVEQLQAKYPFDLVQYSNDLL